MWCDTGCRTGACGGRAPFTRQRPQVRNLSRPPAQTGSQPPSLGPFARRFARRPPPGCGRPLASLARSDPLAAGQQTGRGAAAAGVQLAPLEDPIALVQFLYHFKAVLGRRRPLVVRGCRDPGRRTGRVERHGVATTRSHDFRLAVDGEGGLFVSLGPRHRRRARKLSESLRRVAVAQGQACRRRRVRREARRPRNPAPAA